MNRAAFLSVATALALALPIFAAAQRGSLRGGTIEGEPQPGATTWILMGADAARHDAAGVQLYASRVFDVVAELNPTTGAVGTIADPEEERCACLHFHGS